ncbi:unannotated protein [freshwater metagenome]|uniref:Unannotated protein n=1 Tax=freshwater metagenome TaxID=449393 RepID=A0A6J6SI49_9ZZZZ
MQSALTSDWARSVWTMFFMRSSVSPPQRPYPPRVMRMVSSKPSVVMRPTCAPPRVKMALSTTVDPCTKSDVWLSNASRDIPIDAAADRTESSTPSAKFGGVESAFPRWIGSPAVNTTVSVHVPPTSVATRYFAEVSPMP